MNWSAFWMELGVADDRLTVDEIDFLDRNGYLPLGSLLNGDQLFKVRRHLKGLLEMEGEQAGAELFDSPFIKHPKELGADRLADLVNKGAIFDIFYTHPRVLAAVRHVIGNGIKLSSLNYRAALPGFGMQKLHVDWSEAVQPGDYKVCNSIWLLDDFSAANGATRIVPGTHLKSVLPAEEMVDPEAAHPEEVLIEAPAGTVVVFNSHTWHGGTQNKTDHPRRAIHSYYCREDQPQQLDQRRFIRPETRARLSGAVLKLLAVD